MPARKKPIEERLVDQAGTAGQWRTRIVDMAKMVLREPEMMAEIENTKNNQEVTCA